MANIFGRIAESAKFQNFIIFIIIFASLLIGLQTYSTLSEKYKAVFDMLDLVTIGIFTVEIGIRIAAYGRKPWNFFKSSWNIFDFLVTAVFYIPGGGTVAAILRLARVVRIFRLVTAFPTLQLIVGTLIKSIPSMGYIGLLLFIIFYVFAIVGNLFFGQNDPGHFGNLHISFLTLFQVVTLEGWVDIMKAQGSSPFVPIYFIVFILLGTMMILNLFIGVIVGGFEEVKEEMGKETKGSRNKNVTKKDLKTELAEISDKIAEIKNRLDNLSNK